MYKFSDRLQNVKGIGPILDKKLSELDIITIRDLLLFLPLRYEDLSKISTINQLQKDDLVTIKAKVTSSNLSYRGRRSILRAKIEDKTGKLDCMWFNNPHLKPQLEKNKEMFFSGKINDRGFMIQAKVEQISEDAIHTGRLVPIYSARLGLPQGKLRRILKEIIDNFADDKFNNSLSELEKISDCFNQLHFPDTTDNVQISQERLAVEELLSLIKQSKKIKETWQKNHQTTPIKLTTPPDSIPFELTKAQKKSEKEILADLQKSTAMNRLLIGDVGSGKTVVAGIAIHHVLANNNNAAIVAPTQILAHQHTQSIKKLFPHFEIEIITANNSKKFELKKQPTLYIGTHALINKIDAIKPQIIIYDEQHRFGVMQRSNTKSSTNKKAPHVLTMTATPIPRSLMLTIFSHLSLSLIDEMPSGRIPTKTWLVPQKKRNDAWEWLIKQINKTKHQAIIVCPFIDPSFKGSLENVSAATEVFKETKKQLQKNKSKLKTKLLHGRLNKKDKEKIIKDLFDEKIDILVTTPIIEVGIDLPKASFLIIESAERFGLASLHQIRGRVGRAGQKSYCLLFSKSKSDNSKDRLKIFSNENDGLKLAEQDLRNRGAGNLFGTQQHGFDNLKFASWTNLELITKARELTEKIENKTISWLPFFDIETGENTPMAN